MTLRIIAAALLVAALSSGGEHSAFEALNQVPLKAQSRPNPLEHDAAAKVAGAKLYREHCAECHGVDGSGSRRAPGLRVAPVRGAKPGALFWILTNGVVRHGMPDWSKLTEAERWQIVSYLKSPGPKN
jgi:mono/diheme cytochrome c family protein